MNDELNHKEIEMDGMNIKIHNIEKKLKRIIPTANKIVTRVTETSNSLYRSFISITIPARGELVSIKYDSCHKRSLDKAHLAIRSQINRKKARHR